ncbi:MAG: MmcQ/YjbR family DNA-binding protein [Bacteroidota bacterium]
MKAEFIRDICLAFHGTEEEVKWGNDLCFLTGEKMFCITGIEGEFGVSLKVKDDEFDELIGRDDIIPAPYLARYKWIHVSNPNSFSMKEWKHYLHQSFKLISEKNKIKPKKKKRS